MTGAALVLMGGLALLLGVVAGRSRAQVRADAERACFRLRFPRDLEEEQVVGLLRTVAGMGQSGLVARSVVLELAATPGGIEHRLLVPRAWVETLRGQLSALAPGLQLVPVARPAVQVGSGVSLRLSSLARPLRTDVLVAAAAGLLAALRPLRTGESVLVQWVAVPQGPGRAAQTDRQSSSTMPAVALFLLAFWRAPQPKPLPVAVQRVKTSDPQLAVTGRIGVAAGHAARRGALLQRVLAALAVVQAPGVSWGGVRLVTAWGRTRLVRAVTPLGPPLLLNARELAAVIGWPIGGLRPPGVAIDRSRLFPAAPQLPCSPRILGDATSPANRPVGQRLTDARTHTWVLGPTGVGKSTLLAGLITADLALPQRPAIVVIEPKGDLTQAVLERVPADRRDEVIVLDPASEVVTGFNPLRASGRDGELVADQIYSIFRQLSASWGPRLGDLLHVALLTLVRQPEATLVELPLLLTDDGYRRRALARLDDDAHWLRPVWAWYEGLSAAEQVVVAAPVLSRVHPFVLRAAVRQLVGVAAPNWNFRQVLGEGKVLLVALRPGVIGPETAQLIGALVLAGLWQAATARAQLPTSRRRPALVYLDEWQDYTRLPTSLGEALAQARGFGLGLTLANQHADQLSPVVREAVLANARSKVVFQLGADDARLMARELGEIVTPEDVQGLGAYEAIAALMVDGELVPPVSLRTRPLPAPRASAEDVRRASQRRYGVDRAEVERAIRARHQVELAQPEIRRRRRG